MSTIAPPSNGTNMREFGKTSAVETIYSTVDDPLSPPILSAAYKLTYTVKVLNETVTEKIVRSIV